MARLMTGTTMPRRAIAVAVALAAILGLTGCASPDPAPVQSALATAPGIRDARVVIGHSGTPWHVDPLITLYLADRRADTIVAAVRSAAATIDGSAVARHDVVVFVVTGLPGADADAETDREAEIPEGVDARLGIGERATRYGQIRLTPEDIHRLAGETRRATTSVPTR